MLKRSAELRGTAQCGDNFRQVDHYMRPISKSPNGNYTSQPEHWVTPIRSHMLIYVNATAKQHTCLVHIIAQEKLITLETNMNRQAFVLLSSATLFT